MKRIFAFLWFLFFCSTGIMLVSCEQPSGSTVSDISSRTEETSSFNEISDVSITEPSGSETSQSQESDVSDDESKLEEVSDVSEPESKLEILDIPYTLTSLRITLHDPVYAAGQKQYGRLRTSPEDNVWSEISAPYFELDKGEPSYNEWITKYTEEWFRDNYLIVFRDTLPEFKIENICIYFDNSGENVKKKLLFVRCDETPADFTWDGTYDNVIFIEITKEDIPFELTDDLLSNEWIYECMHYDVAEQYGYPVPEE